MQPTISQLKNMFEHKITIFKRILTYVKPVKQFAEDTGLVYSEESEELILERHIFGKDKGLLPIIKELIDLNRLILSYDKPEHMGELAVRHYESMIEDIKKEQKFLAIFAQSLEEIVDRKGFKDYWRESFEHYQNLVDLLRGDLTSLKRVYETTAKITANSIINLIATENFDGAIAFLNEDSTAKSLGEDGENFFRRLIAAIKAEDIAETEKISDEGKDVLDIDEYLLLKRILIARIKPAILMARQQPAMMDEAPEVVKNLAEEAEALDIIRREAGEAEAPIAVIREISRIRQRLRIVRKKFGKRVGNRWKLISDAVKVRYGSMHLRQRVNAFLEKKRQASINILNKEYEKISRLLQAVAEIKIKPELKPKADELIRRARSLLEDVKLAVALRKTNLQDVVRERLSIKPDSLFPRLWEQLTKDRNVFGFMNKLAKSVSAARDKLEIVAKNMSRDAISRRAFLKYSAAAGAAAAAGGAAWWLSRGTSETAIRSHSQEKMDVEPKPNEPEEIKLKTNVPKICNTGLKPEEEKRLASYTEKYSLEEHDPNIVNRTYENRLQDHDILLGYLFGVSQIKFKTLNDLDIQKIKSQLYDIEEVRKILFPSLNQKFAFFDIGPGIANKDLTILGGRGKPAITSQETAELFPFMPVIIVDLPSEVDRFTGLSKEDKRYIIDEDKRRDLLSHDNIHIIRGDGLISLLEQYYNPSTNPYPNRHRPNLYANTTIIIRIANSIDVYCNWKNDCCPAITRIGIDFENSPVLLFFNRDILLKRAGSTQWTIIGHVSPMGFSHNTRLLTRRGEAPFIITAAFAGNNSNASFAKNILFIGSDKWKGREGMDERGDALVVVNSDPITNTINVLAIPRDTYVTIRGRNTKINHALAWGGWQLQKSAVEDFLGVKMDRVFFVDGDRLRDLVYVARHYTNTNIVQDVFRKAGYAITAVTTEKTWENIFSFVNETLPIPFHSIGSFWFSGFIFDAFAA